VVALLSFVVLEEMLCSWQIIFFDYSKRARLLKTDIKDTRENSRVFFYFNWFCPLSWETESRANFDFVEYGFSYEKCNGQKNKETKKNKKKCVQVVFFSTQQFKKDHLSLYFFKKARREKNTLV